MGRFFAGGVVMSSRMASKTALNWLSYLRSSAASLRARSACAPSIWRKRIGNLNHLFHYRRLYCRSGKRSIVRCLVKIPPLDDHSNPSSSRGGAPQRSLTASRERGPSRIAGAVAEPFLI